MSLRATRPLSWSGFETAPSTAASAGTWRVLNIDPSTTWLPGVYWLIARLATRTLTSPFALSTLERYLCA